MRPPKTRQTAFGLYLSQIREQQRLTIKDLAVMAGISPSYISQLETGKRPPTPTVIRTLSGALDIRPNQLFIQAGILTMPLEATLRAETQLETLTLEVTIDQRDQLLEFLEFLRYKASLLTQ